ncbi:MAG: peptidylprolyl isomerase [Levilactobacillus sp.]|jgi:foldase protein PrsA|uniref:Foldase protein PrsA n=1 Tax=Levilactobacillus suantsaiihabitans TaxID=2487722 RepID=A0A4Z0J7P5_9LACO|nr:MULTISPECIES: peptidylprolyl isomerase PrsA [Levilactobacillus]MCH4123078.1 peptidylprolyl isomerase [Levilactobacillus sp.]MCI1552784.1 peptidylprolyl isomerase [Levilactobacillus sp.]MCI1598873.1 peptidylprolyl isomerase [Levilactobacillus sp.]MCI1606514.1 peptidylprolyl isomerase [Levilactobacillus sp.]TGD18076.1 peptidylprolyl isomerase [Levilactobacillus suantsaiihabitans]
MKKWFIAFAGLLLTVTLAGCGSQTVATTNGGKITESAYYSSLKGTSSGKQVLQQMILNKVLEKQYGSKVSKSAVNKQFNTYKSQYGSSFKSVLSQSGMTESSLKTEIRSNLLLKEAVKDNVTVTDAQLKKQFKSYEPKVTVAHILVSKKSTAQTIIKDLKGTKKSDLTSEFTKLAKKYSTDTATKNKGGKLSAFDSTDTSLDSTFKKAAFKLSTDEYTATPVKTQYGYHVILMLKNPGKGTIKEHKAELKKQIIDNDMNDSTVLHNVVAKVLKKGNVSIKDNDLKNILSDYLSTSSSSKSSSSSK